MLSRHNLGFSKLTDSQGDNCDNPGPGVVDQIILSNDKICYKLIIDWTNGKPIYMKYEYVHAAYIVLMCNCQLNQSNKFLNIKFACIFASREQLVACACL